MNPTAASPTKFKIQTDGSVRKLARGIYFTAVGAIISIDDVEVCSVSAFTGKGTSNTAEFDAILTGLRMLVGVYGYRGLDKATLEVVSDSEIAINTLKDTYENRHFKPVVGAIWFELAYLLNLKPKMIPDPLSTNILAWAHRVTFTHVRREQNVEADKLATLYTHRKPIDNTF